MIIFDIKYASKSMYICVCIGDGCLQEVAVYKDILAFMQPWMTEFLMLVTGCETCK